MVGRGAIHGSIIAQPACPRAATAITTVEISLTRIEDPLIPEKFPGTGRRRVKLGRTDRIRRRAEATHSLRITGRGDIFTAIDSSGKTDPFDFYTRTHSSLPLVILDTTPTLYPGKSASLPEINQN